ncbi:MAG: hypothetical protein QF405_05535 [Roseibacillus sp.]|nr:hypothetical protein [Roseibacillus sp.]MDP7307086.1 hypothetical protein [Roseibacillus sp.]
MRHGRNPIFLSLPLIVLLPLSAAADSREAVTVEISPEGFNASRTDIHAVCRSAADQLLRHMVDLRKTKVLVSKGAHGPIVLFKKGENGEHLIKLATEKLHWAQYAYQFSHEICHVLCGYENDHQGNLWFEETLCETASLYCLRRMSVEWRTNAPYENWKSFSSSLRDYTDDIERNRQDYLEITRTGLPAYYRKHARHLSTNATDRDKNGAMALVLLAAFERQPRHWNAIRWLNSSPSPGDETFAQYLSKWHRAVPGEHAGFVSSLAALYGIPLEERKLPEKAPLTE